MTDRAETPGHQPGTSKTTTQDLSAGDFTYVRKKRGRIRFDDEHIDGEINIVPYLDIMVNLIMFLLMVQATSIALGMINVNAPSYSPPGPTTQAPTKDPKKILRLTVGIASDGFYIAAKGGVLPGEAPEGENPDAERQPTIPRRADGKYDFAGLARKLRGIKNAFPDVEAIYVAADDTTAYQDIVKTLDASRADSAGPLFPNVAFTQIN
ncbi:MAG: biopolymer transporter ExbD [Myxococcota bacterium]